MNNTIEEIEGQIAVIESTIKMASQGWIFMSDRAADFYDNELAILKEQLSKVTA